MSNDEQNKALLDRQIADLEAAALHSPTEGDEEVLAELWDLRAALYGNEGAQS